MNASNKTVSFVSFYLRRLPTVQPIFLYLCNTSALSGINDMAYFCQHYMKI